jgi:hypothetical protein
MTCMTLRPYFTLLLVFIRVSDLIYVKFDYQLSLASCKRSSPLSSALNRAK